MVECKKTRGGEHVTCSDWKDAQSLAGQVREAEPASGEKRVPF